MDNVGAYDRWHDEGAAAATAPPEATAPWHVLALRHLGEVSGARVLEIACGSGAFARELVLRGADLTAADFSPRAVELTADLLAGGASTVVADVQELPFPSESFDLVVSLETLEHVTDPDRGLAELVRVTKRHGRLIVTTPNYISIAGLYRVYLRLTGRRFAELGQPINNPLTLVGRVVKLRRLGCRIDVVDGGVYQLPIPRYRDISLRFLEHPHAITKWFGQHGLTAATRL